MRGKPPFRADHVGSFLRPARLTEARDRHAAGRCSDDELRALEDECIREVVRRQEEVGLTGITDGEFRRTYFHVDFLERLQGVSVTYGDFTVAFRKDDGTEVGFRPPTMHVDGALRHGGPIQGADYDFLASVVSRTPKVCIPAPSMLHFRGGRQAISSDAYPDLETLLRRSDIRLSGRDRRPRRARLPLPADGRHQFGLSVRSGDPQANLRARRRPGCC